MAEGCGEEGMRILARHCPQLERFGEYGKREINAERRRALASEETLSSICNVFGLPELTAEAKLRIALSLIRNQHPSLTAPLAPR